MPFMEGFPTNIGEVDIITRILKTTTDRVVGCAYFKAFASSSDLFFVKYAFSRLFDVMSMAFSK